MVVVEDFLPMEYEMYALDADDDNPDSKRRRLGDDDGDVDMVPITSKKKKPHRSVIEYFLQESEGENKYIGILAQKVIGHTRLKLMIDDLMDSLHRARDDVAHGFGLRNFSGKVNELFSCRDFIQACVDTYFEDDCHNLTVDVLIYKSEKEPHERMESLREDLSLDIVLAQKECSRITRGVLSVLFGYWSDDTFYEKLARGIDDVDERNQKPPTESRVERVDGIDFPATVEGLKDALVSRFTAEDNAVKIACEEIERKRTLYESVFGNCKENRIKWFTVTWAENEFFIERKRTLYESVFGNCKENRIKWFTVTWAENEFFVSGFAIA